MPGRRPITQEVVLERTLKIEELRRRRIQIGMSSKTIAAMLNTDRSNIRHLERMDMRHGDKAIARYEAALKTHLAKILLLAQQWGYV